jgi:tRNA-dihydrouridine synthase
MITLHPRTVKQGYSGMADWRLIKELKQLVDIPVVGNGDMTSPEMAKQMLEQTGCDYIMIGRGAMGNPFLFKQINDYFKTGKYQHYSFKDRLDAFFEYITLASNYKIKFSNIKGQAMYFTRGFPGATVLRSEITRTKTITELVKVLDKAYTTDQMIPLSPIEN